MLILLVALGRFGDAVIGSFGYAQNIYGIAALLCAGHGIAVVASLAPLRQDSSGSAARSRLLRIMTTAWASTAVLIVLAAVFGALSALILPIALPVFLGTYLATMTSAIFLPIAQSLSGLQQVRGHEHRSLLHTVEGFIISIGLSLAAINWATDAAVAVTAVGVACVAGDLWSTLRRYRSLAGEIRGIPTLALRSFVEAPRAAFALVPRTAAGGYDGLILMGAFLVVSQVALLQSPATGAAVVSLIAVVRTIVVPLKSFGIVGGRLIRKQTTDPTDTARLFWRLVRVGAIALTPVGLVCVIAPGVAMAVLHLPDTADAELAVRLIGVQLLLEPITGLGAAMLKVLIAPTALLAPLAIALWAWAVPAVLIANLFTELTAASIWGILLIGRLLFCALVIRSTMPSRLQAKPVP
ncbi:MULTISPECIES: hypothetical protein [unclassified Plantibacter]|uniref:hypothetical protein n=1 Tax=unclassified Plantibacter TaxID=2624265 RepID=UPI000AAD4A4C|nr:MULTISPECIES: hypothetical protein [unclassified Plantibacter]